MRFLARILCTCLIIVGLAVCLDVASDKHQLRDNLIRLHVVGASDSEEDQQIKLRVRDAIVEKLSAVMQQLPDKETAKQYLKGKLQEIKELADSVLQEAGVKDRCKVTLDWESFDRRDYDTFSLPAGVYESLQVTIGEAEGKNWWCVVFPSLCLPATSQGFADTAVGAGFSDTLTDTLTQEEDYTVRFFLLDCLGWLENWFFAIF